MRRAESVEVFPTVYGTRSLSTVFTRACHWPVLNHMRSLLSLPSHVINIIHFHVVLHWSVSISVTNILRMHLHSLQCVLSHVRVIRFDHSSIRRGVQVMELLIMQFSSSSSHFLCRGPIVLSTRVQTRDSSEF